MKRTWFICMRGAVLAAEDGGDYALWKSDGTESGAALAADIYTGAFGSYPDFFGLSGPLLVFGADDGDHGMEPWRLDV